MKRFAIEGDLSRVTVAEEPAAFMNLFRQLTDLSHMTSTAPVRSPERERKKGGPCQVADDVTRFVTMLQTLRTKTRLLSVGLPYDETMLTARFKVNKISRVFEVGAVVPFSDHCLNKTGFKKQPLLSEPGCTAMVRESYESPKHHHHHHHHFNYHFHYHYHFHHHYYYNDHDHNHDHNDHHDDDHHHHT
ncbi:hypothetical protein V5799_032548 [Amblyomma americanum]|uniref:Uncharacterized protein n=1 Tax=Amblyomma americanum TaxID=6943 RepID=A0AAQ4DQV3_AMBAM